MDSRSGFEPTEEAGRERFPAWFESGISLPEVLCPWLEQGASDDGVFPQQIGNHPSASPLQLVALRSRASSPNVHTLGGYLSWAAPPSTADTIYDSSTPLSTDLPSTGPPTDCLLSSQSTVDPGMESFKAFFVAALGSSEKIRVARLTSVVESFSKGFSDGFKTRLSEWYNFWPKLDVVFESGPIPETVFEAGVACRLRRLGQARSKIKKKDWVATRLWLLFLAHEVEYISQWEHVDLFTSRGVDSMSIAIKMATKYLGTAKRDYTRAKKILQVMKEGGPASVLENGGLPQSIWEIHMTMDDITCAFACIKSKLPDLYKGAKSHNKEVSEAILDGFKKYGWSFSSLRVSQTQVMVLLKPYFHSKRPYADVEPGDSESSNKKRRVDHFGASLPFTGHHFPTNLSNPGSNDFDPATSSRNTVESTPPSKSTLLATFDANDRARDLTDPVMASNLSYAVNSLDELVDRGTADKLVYAVDDTDEFADPTTTSNLDYANEITGLATATANDQLIDILSSVDYGMNQLTDSSVVQFLQWTVSEPAEFTDPSTESFLRGAIPQRNLRNDSICPLMTDRSTTLLRRSTNDEESGGSWYVERNELLNHRIGGNASC